MPKFLAAFALVMVLAAPAFALTTERGGTNSDGAAKFSDPDEQRPGFMNGATEDENTGIAQGGNANVGQMQLTPNSHIGLYSNHFGAQQQQDAFDQAYSHK